MKTFDDLEVRRPGLAQAYLALLGAQPGRSRCLHPGGSARPSSWTTTWRPKRIPGAKPTISRVRSSIEKLKRNGLLSKNASGTAIDDPLFAEYLRQRGARGAL